MREFPTHTGSAASAYSERAATTGRAPPMAWWFSPEPTLRAVPAARAEGAGAVVGVDEEGPRGKGPPQAASHGLRAATARASDPRIVNTSRDDTNIRPSRSSTAGCSGRLHHD